MIDGDFDLQSSVLCRVNGNEKEEDNWADSAQLEK